MRRKTVKNLGVAGNPTENIGLYLPNTMYSRSQWLVFDLYVHMQTVNCQFVCFRLNDYHS